MLYSVIVVEVEMLTFEAVVIYFVKFKFEFNVSYCPGKINVVEFIVAVFCNISVKLSVFESMFSRLIIFYEPC